MEQAFNSLTMDDNNLETFSLVWFHPSIHQTKENIAVQQRLRLAINYLKIYQNSSECENYICSLSKDERIILLVNDRSGEGLVDRIHQLPQVVSIYVYCTCDEIKEQWPNKFTKVRDIIVPLDALVTQIQSDQIRRNRNNVDEPFPFSIFDINDCQNQSTTGLNGQFVYSQLLLGCILRMKSNSTDKNELIKVCKKYYDGNSTQLDILNEFEHKYLPDKALWWYTRESFLYQLLNKALRTRNIDLLFLFRFFIGDIRRQLEQYQCPSSIHIYRGQVMSNEELQFLKDSVGRFISINSFLSTSINRQVALFYLTDATLTNDLQKVLFDIDADPRLAENRPFANIASQSQFREEEEVLIMPGSIFRLVDIRHDQDQVYIIQMILSNNSDSDFQTVIEQITIKNDEDNDETHDLLSLGNMLCDMGKLNDAKKYYRRLLDELPHDHEYVAHCYYGLGKVAHEQGDFDLSLECHQKSLEIKKRTLNADDPRIANSYHRLGSVYVNKDDHKRALKLYHKAFEIRKRIYGENHLTISSYFNNVGLVYEKERKYLEALESLQKAVAILQKCVSANHPWLGGSHGNIGNVYRNLGQDDLALYQYNLSLEIFRKSLSPQHPSYAETFSNMSLIYESKCELKQALLYLEQAAAIDSHEILPTHPRAIKTKQSIERISTKLK